MSPLEEIEMCLATSRLLWNQKCQTGLIILPLQVVAWMRERPMARVVAEITRPIEGLGLPFLKGIPPDVKPEDDLFDLCLVQITCRL